MDRRTFIQTAAASGAAMFMPSIGRAQNAKLLRAIPNGSLVVLDPHGARSDVTRDHAFAAYDTLYSMNERYEFEPQMIETQAVEDGGLRWTLTLRPGLIFHDGERVLAKDCVASIRRWAKRDGFGASLMAATDELSAPDDRRIVFRLKRAFPLLPAALGKASAFVPAIMPERLAMTDAFAPITEVVGSGPFRFKKDEFMIGEHAAYERFDKYVPREGGGSGWTAGPKRVFFDRIEWRVLADPSTAAAALQAGEVDWWITGAADLAPVMKRDPNLIVESNNPLGSLSQMRINHLHPPFDNPAVRRALLPAIDQTDFMVAVAGVDPEMYKAGVGFFPPGSPSHSDAGMEPLTGKRDLERAKRELAAAGYKGERIKFLMVTNYQAHKLVSDVAVDLLTKLGFNVDVQTTDLNTRISLSNKKEPPAQGGWNVFCTSFAGMDIVDPASNDSLRGNGDKGTYGWCTSPRLEQLNADWLVAPDQAARQAVAADLQRQALIDLPYYPIGQNFPPSARRKNIVDRRPGFPVYWNVKKA